MNTKILRLLPVPLLAAPLALQAQPVFTDPVGAKTQSLATGFHAFSSTFVNAKSFQGTISSVLGPTVTFTSGDLSGYGGGDYFLEVVSGPFAGFMAGIASSDAGSVTADVSMEFLNGDEQVAIRQHMTISSLLEGANVEFGNQGEAILIYFDEFGQQVQLYNSTTSGDFRDVVTDQPVDKILAPGEGLFMFLSAPATVTTLGSVKTGVTSIALPGAFTPAIRGVLNPVSGVTLSDSGLLDAIQNNDVVIVVNQDGSAVQSFVQGGQLIDANDGVTDNGSLVMAPGSAVVVVSASGGLWDIPIVYNQ